MEPIRLAKSTRMITRWLVLKKKRHEKVIDSIKMEPFVIPHGLNSKRRSPPDERPNPLINITRAPLQANCADPGCFQISDKSEGNQLPRQTKDP